MTLQIGNRVTIIDTHGNPLGQGTIFNINNYREPSLKYAVDLDGYTEDLMFLGENLLVKNEEEI